MRSRGWPQAAALTFGLTLSGCGTLSISSDLSKLEQELAVMSQDHPAETPSARPVTEWTEPFKSTLDLKTVLSTARTRNPELRQAVARAHAAIAGARGAGRLEDPRLSLESREIPRRQPASFNRADMNMLGLTQDIPFPGNLSLRADGALRDAESMVRMAHEKEREIVARVKKAYIEYFVSLKELGIYNDHLKILEEFEKISETRYRTGAVSQQDVLKPQVEIILLNNSLLTSGQKIETLKSTLNALMDLPMDTMLGKPAEIELKTKIYDLKTLEARAHESRPELRAAEQRVLSAQSSLTLAEREAWLPDFSIGAAYLDTMDRDDAVQGMLGLNLPWFTGKRSAEVAQKKHFLRAAEADRDAVRNRVLLEVRDAYLRVEALRKSALLLRGEALPKSRQTIDISRSTYEKEKSTFLDLLDAERSERDIQMNYYRTLGEYESALADLEQAVGIDLDTLQ